MSKHSVHWGINSPSKTPPSFSPSPLLNLQRPPPLFFFVKHATSPPEEVHPDLSQQPPLKIEILSGRPLFENLLGGCTLLYDNVPVLFQLA